MSTVARGTRYCILNPLDAQDFGLLHHLGEAPFLSCPWDKNLVPCEMASTSMMLAVLSLIRVW
jgi:hypothetical protein